MQIDISRQAIEQRLAAAQEQALGGQRVTRPFWIAVSGSLKQALGQWDEGLEQEAVLTVMRVDLMAVTMLMTITEQQDNEQSFSN